MAKSKIVRICKNQAELAVKIVQPGCNGGQVIGHEDIFLVIKAPKCPHRYKSPWIVEGCWPGYDGPRGCEPTPDQYPAIYYPAFNIDDEGRAVFRFDNKLYRLPQGRYIGTIEFGDTTPIATLDIDLCNTPFSISEVVTTTVSCTEEGRCS